MAKGAWNTIEHISSEDTDNGLLTQVPKKLTIYVVRNIPQHLYLYVCKPCPALPDSTTHTHTHTHTHTQREREREREYTPCCASPWWQKNLCAQVGKTVSICFGGPHFKRMFWVSGKKARAISEYVPVVLLYIINIGYLLKPHCSSR